MEKEEENVLMEEVSAKTNSKPTTSTRASSGASFSQQHHTVHEYIS